MEAKDGKIDEKTEIKKILSNNRILQIGVTRFELAASASLRRRSNQTEPHPGNKMNYSRLQIKMQAFFTKKISGASTRSFDGKEKVC